MPEMANSLGRPLLEEKGSFKEDQEACIISLEERGKEDFLDCKDYCRRYMVESKKLWQIAGPAVFTRLTMYGTGVVTQAFVGHLGDLELAAISISTTVVVGLSFGLLLGMGSALETLCGQAFGARQYHMLGVYLQRSWIVLFVVSILLLPIYFYATPILKLMGQSDDIAQLSGMLAIWFIPQHIGYAFSLPLQRYLQSQLKNAVIAWMSGAAFLVHIVLSWLFIQKLEMGIVGAAITLNLSLWLPLIGQFLYVVCGGCPLTWNGFSREAFLDLWPFIKLSVASGVMLVLEIWYYRVLILLTGHLKNAQVALDSLAICMNINGIEVMIPLGFLAATGVRVANELGSGNGKGAKFAVIVAVTTSMAIGLIFWVLILTFRNDFALVFTDSAIIIEAVSKLAYLLAFTILLNSVQPVLSGVAIGSGWQSIVAYVNIACYYVIGVPFGVILGWVFHLRVLGIWAGMISGTAVQTLVLVILTYRCDWDREAAKAIEHVKKWSSAPYKTDLK
uniref:Protein DETOXIFICATION n=1 Tax=Araucaria cunninghamii TaxID=56994 RepID=A0A0D6R1H8_ARACU